MQQSFRLAKLAVISFLVFDNIFISSLAFAEIENGRWTNRQEAIKTGVHLAPITPDRNDPYRPVAWMTRGQFRGQEVDTTVRRPLLKLVGNDKILRYANVDYKDEFWIAEIPIHGVADFFVQQHDFFSPQPVAHTEMFAQFKPGFEVRLISQDRSKRRRVVKVSALNISGEATGPKGIGFLGIPDLLPRTILVLRIRGIDFKLAIVPKKTDRPPQDPNNPFYIYHLKIPDQFYRDRLLLTSLDMSAQLGFNQVYNLAGPNCTTITYKLLDLSLRDMPNYHVPRIFGFFFNRSPRSTAQSIYIRGLYDQGEE